MAKSVIKLIVDGDSRGARAALKSAGGEADSTGNSLKKFGEIAAASFAVAGAVAVDFAKHAVQAAEDEDAAHVRLLQALKNTKQSWQEESAVIEAVDKSSEQFGYTTADTEDALSKLEVATGSTSKSLMLLQVAQNIAAGTGKDFSTVLLGVIKLSEGNSRVLKQMGIDVAIPAGGALNTAKALEAVAKAQQHVTDVENANNLQTENQGLALDRQVATAKQHLLDLEQQWQVSKTHTLSMQQAIVNAERTLAVVEAGGATTGAAAALKLQQAKDALASAQDKLNNVQNAGNNMVAATAKLYAGDASASANTFQGNVRALKAEWTDFEAKIGNEIIPIIEHMMKVLSDPNTIEDVKLAWYSIEKAITDVISVVDAAINPFIAVFNAAERISNAIHGNDASAGTIPHLPTSFNIGPAPGADSMGGQDTSAYAPNTGLGVPYGPIEPGEYRSPYGANRGRSVVSGPLEPGETLNTWAAIAAELKNHTALLQAIVHQGSRSANPSLTSQNIQRHQKRNGSNAVNGRFGYDATPTS